MSHLPTPPAGSPGTPTDVVTRIHSLLSGVALPKSKTAKTVSVPLATFQSLLDLTADTLRSVAESPFTTLCNKIDSLAQQFTESQKALSYAQVAASESKKPVSSRASPMSASTEAPVPEPHPPRFDFILRQQDYKHPALARDTPADIQCKINDILTRVSFRSDPTNNPDSPPLRVRAVAKLRNGNIRLMWHNQNERDIAHCNYEEWVPELSPKLELLHSSYRVVVHGVPTTLDLHDDTARKEAAQNIVQENTYLGEAQFAEDVLDNLQWMSRRSGPPADKPHSSLIMFFTEPSSANLAIEHGIAFSGRLLRAQRYHSLPTQCYNCHRFGHIARYCRSRATCGRCAGTHATSACRCPCENACDNMSQCKHVSSRCTLCKGPHSATSRDCPTRMEVFTRCLAGHQQFGRYYYVPDST